MLLIVSVLFGVILSIIAVNDLLFFRIEDEYVLALMLLYIFSCIIGVSGHHMVEGVITAVVVFIITLIMNQYGKIGGGDVKLLVPLLLFTETNWVEFLTGLSISGLVLGIIYCLFGHKIFFLRRRLVLSLYLFNKKHRKSIFLNIILLSLRRINKKSVAFSRYDSELLRREIPYGVALAFGGFFLIMDWYRW